MQSFLLDHEVLRKKFRALRERCFPSLKHEYHLVEEEIVSTPNWPPVGSDPITAVYNREASYTDLGVKETDCMLPRGDGNNSSTLHSSTTSFTPRTSTTDQPYLSMTSIGSSKEFNIEDRLGSFDEEGSTGIPSPGAKADPSSLAIPDVRGFNGNGSVPQVSDSDSGFVLHNISEQTEDENPTR